MTDISHLLGKVHNCDCLEFMKQLPDKCVDLVLTDPPYGVNMGEKINNNQIRDKYTCFEDTEEYIWKIAGDFLREMIRISPLVVITPGVRNMYIYPPPTHTGAIHQPAGIGVGRFGFLCWQPILYYGKDPFHGFGSRPDSFENTERSEKNGHPCPKPIKLWTKILERCSKNQTDTVFDPFMGSGTTAVACERLGRKWFGCELEPKYVEIANKRIEAERAQLKLF